MTLEEIPKDIMHANHHVSIWWSFKRKWRGPFKSFGGVRSFPVFPGPATEAPAACQSSGGFTQDGLTEGMEMGVGGGRALRGLWLDITRRSRAARWWGPGRGTMGRGGRLLNPALPCLQQKPAEQLVKDQKYPSNQKKKKACNRLRCIL